MVQELTRPESLVIIVLDELHRDGKGTSQLWLQMVVCRLQKVDPETWADFKFDDRSLAVMPWSEELDDVLVSLQRVGVVQPGLFGGYFVWTDEARHNKSVVMAESHLGWVAVDNIRCVVRLVSRNLS